MHIMFIPSWYSNFRNKVQGSFFKEQAKGLSEAGIKVSVAFNEIYPLTLIGKMKEKKGISFKLEDGLNTYRYKGYNYFPKNPLMFKLFNKRMDLLYREIVEKEGKIDLIHAHSSLWGGIAATYISKKYNIPLVITEHSSFSRGRHVKEGYKKFILDSYRKADTLITVGSGLKKELEDFTGREDIKVIPNLVDLELFKPVEIQRNDKFTFFTVAFLEGQKGMKDLIKSFSSAFNGGDEQLIIGGNGSEKPYLEELVKNLGLEKQVKFLGALSRKEVAMEMNKCDCFILASPYETFGVVYIEAMACGKPVIGIHNGGADDIINEMNGIIVEKNNEIDLCEAMINMKNNIGKYSSFDIIKQCKNKYSKEIIVTKIIEEYNKVL